MGIVSLVLVFLFGMLIISPVKEIVVINTTTHNKNSQPDFIKITETFAKQHNYTSNKYDCRKYTIDLYQEYLRNNISAEPVIGYNLTDNHDYAHAFIKVVVYLEPQTGKIKDFTKEYEYIENYDDVMDRYRQGLYEGIDTK